LSFFIDDEVKGPVRVKERQSVPSGVLVQPLMRDGKITSVCERGAGEERRLNPEAGSDDISIDAKGALFERDRVHQSGPIANAPLQSCVAASVHPLIIIDGPPAGCYRHGNLSRNGVRHSSREGNVTCR
jgi:hypothetical protein